MGCRDGRASVMNDQISRHTGWPDNRLPVVKASESPGDTTLHSGADHGRPGGRSDGGETISGQAEAQPRTSASRGVDERVSSEWATAASADTRSGQGCLG